MRDTIDSLMVFAAGFGTRMGALTANRPKPLIEVAGRPLLDHALGLADAAGAGPVVVNTHYLGDKIRSHLANRNVLISDEADRILDTGGGLRKALPLLGPGPVMTLNSDVIWTGANPLDQLRSAWDPERMDALLLCIEPDSAVGRDGPGDFAIAPDGRMARGGPMIYGGAQIVRTEGLAGIGDPVFSLNVLWNRMIEAGRLYGLVHRGRWCDVGRPEGIALAEDVLRQDDV